ncbi:MAG: CC0125/CC1285 family lipoprotein [Gammaproteobacteria bacterium]
MKQLLLCTLIASLCACGTSDPYVGGEGAGLGTYTESRLTDDRYRVTFIGEPNATADQVKDLALLRAAEITLANDYDWFRVVNQETQEQTTVAPAAVTTTSPAQQVTRDCGPLGCTTTVTPAYTGTQVVTVEQDDRFTTSIEFVMGDGSLRDPTVAYNADELHDSLTRRY